MRKLSTILTNYDSPTTGFSEGKIRDNPGDDTGSGVVASWGNDLYYAFTAFIKKYRTGGVLSDAAESETSSDFINALEEMVGLRVDGISEWSAATTYSTLNQKVMRYGMQFVNINTTSNINQDPITSPIYWLPVPTFQELLADSVSGRLIFGGHRMHNYNSPNYRQYFSLGTHRVGGSSGASYNAWGVHLDGTTAGVGTALRDSILTGWHLQTTFAPSFVLVDHRGRVTRAIEATGGQADLMAESLNDQVQGHYHGLNIQSELNSSVRGAATNYIAGSNQDRYQFHTATDVVNTVSISSPVADPTNGTPRTGLFTRDKSITLGVPYMVIVQPV